MRKAVALTYDKRYPAPFISGIGSGELAEKIVGIAEQHDILMVEDAKLVEVLSEQEIGDLIPVELYDVIAEVLAFVYHVRGS
jgi:flagellar biosynthesis protein